MFVFQLLMRMMGMVVEVGDRFGMKRDHLVLKMSVLKLLIRECERMLLG